MTDVFRILIGYDGSHFADAALDDLRLAGLPESVEALILGVAEVWLPPVEPGEKPEFVTEELKRHYEENLEILGDAKRLAESAAERLRGVFPGWTVSAEATYGSAAWEILFRATEYNPDLIVIGAQGVHGLRELLIGSVAQKIVTEARSSVRVARGKIEVDAAPVRIVLGYDGTRGADKAAESIAARNWPPDSKVRVVMVRDTAFVRKSFAVEDDQIEAIGRRVTDRLAKAGIDAELDVREGNPKRILVDEAEDFGADVIFLGASKFDDVLTKYLLGSVASAIVTRAKCSVEIVR